MCSAQPQSIRVLVANRSGIESELLAEAIGKARRFLTVGWSVQRAKIHSLAVERQPDVLLITPKLDDDTNTGFDLLSDFRLSHPRLKIVVLLESGDPDLVVQSFRLGARGVFSKDLPLKTLIKCIACVHKGQFWATNEQLGFVLEALAGARGVRPCRNGNLSKLSVRELEIVNSLTQGLSNDEIAQRLHLSRHTVKNYTGKIVHKLGTSSRSEIISQALKPPHTASDWNEPPEERRAA